MTHRCVYKMIILVSLFIPLLGFALQSYPRLFNKYFGVDVWTRLLEIEHVKRAKHKIPGKITKGFLINGYFDYPIIFPFLFSFFSKKILLEIQGFVSPFFDMFQNILVFFIAFQLTDNISIAIVAQIIYALTPMIPVENSYMTPRSLGYLLFTLAFYPLLQFHITGNVTLLVISFIFTSLLFLTHRFALQSLFFIILFFSVIDVTFTYLATFFAAFLAATIISGGYYLRVLKGHIANIYFWIANYKYRFAHQIYGNSKQKKQDWVGNIYRLMSLFSPVFLLSIDVWASAGFLYLYLLSTPALTLPTSQIFIKMAVWIIFFYVFAAIVLKVKQLIPIGEGQRYLEMATVPSSILSSILFFSFYHAYGTIAMVIFVLLLLGNLSLILYIQIKGIIYDKNRSLTKELTEMFSYINKLPGKPKIICIPHQITTMTVYNTKAEVLVNADNPGLMKITDIYPVLKKPLTELRKKYGLDYVLLRETFAKKRDLKLEKAKEMHRAGDIVLLKF